MTDPLYPSTADSNRSDPKKESREFARAVFLILLLLAACLLLPFFAATIFGWWWGFALALLALPVWIYLGPPPMPGFLNGFFALNGLLAILGVALCLLLRALP